MDKILADKIESLKNKISITCRSRFNAYRRLKKHNDISLSGIAMLSISAISMALINVFINDPTCNNFATAISVIFPILVLSISLIESSKDYSTIANKMLLCGQQLNTLISSIEYTKIEKLEDLQKINNDYNQIIKSFSEINHEDIDVYVTLCKNPSLSGQRDKINWFFRLKTWFFSNVWEYKTSWLSLLIAFTLSGLYLFFIN